MLAPGRSRIAASGRLVIATALVGGGERRGQQHPRLRGVVVVPTIWSSKTPTAATRNDSGTASFRSALPLRSFGIADQVQDAPRPQVLPRGERGVDDGLAAAAGPNIRPAVILTRSPVTPSESSGLENTCTPVSGWPPGTGSAMLYSVATVSDATAGRAASAAKYRAPDLRRRHARPPGSTCPAGCPAGGLPSGRCRSR